MFMQLRSGQLDDHLQEKGKKANDLLKFLLSRYPNFAYMRGMWPRNRCSRR
jgi:hypothetical protein